MEKLCKKKYVRTRQLLTVANENDKEIPKKRYMSPEERKEIIDDLKLK